jgi:hypothetical protein
MGRARDLANLGTITNNIATSNLATSYSTVSESYVDTGFSVTLNKKLSSSRILVIADLSIGSYQASSALNGIASVKIVESVNNLEKDYKGVVRVYNGGGAIATVNRVSLTFIDTNTGVGNRTYKVYLKCLGSSAELSGFNNLFTSDLTAIETF